MYAPHRQGGILCKATKSSHAPCPGERKRARTKRPDASNLRQRARPMKPDAPVTSTREISSGAGIFMSSAEADALLEA